MNLLVVKLSAIGDVVLSLPFLEAVRRRYPEAGITWLVEEAAADIVTDHPLIDRVVISRRKSWMRGLKQGRLLSTAREVRGFISDLRQGAHDPAVDLQGLFKSGILTRLSGASRRIGFDKTREFSYLFPERAPGALRSWTGTPCCGTWMWPPTWARTRPSGCTGFPFHEEAVRQAAALLAGIEPAPGRGQSGGQVAHQAVARGFLAGVVRPP